MANGTAEQMDILEKELARGLRELTLVEDEDLGGWEHVKIYSSVEIKRKRDQRNNAFWAVKSVGTIPASPDDIIKCIVEEQHRGQWVKLIESDTSLTMTESGLEVAQMCFRSPFPLCAGRDFCVVRKVLREEDGSVLMPAVSVDNIYNCPKYKSYVRATFFCAGFVVRPIQDDPPQCLVTYCVQCDFKGWVPAFASNFITEKIAVCIVDLRDYIVMLQEEAALDREEEEEERREKMAENAVEGGESEA